MSLYTRTIIFNNILYVKDIVKHETFVCSEEKIAAWFAKRKPFDKRLQLD